MMIKVQQLICLIAFVVFSFTTFAQTKTGNVTLQFLHFANQQALVLVDSAYKNSVGEWYQPTRLKYYVSNVTLLTNDTKSKQKKMVHLIDAAAEPFISLTLQPGVYDRISFSIGVDSALNCSGAQSGALDPVNGMFWTWNTGYIYFKLEGYSAESTNDLQKIEYHIGGYTGEHKANRNVVLPLAAPLTIVAGKRIVINLLVDLDKFWRAKNIISIATNALIMSPGALAAAAADNLPAMFSIGSIE